MNIDELTIIIPTWNSMPELEKTLESISKAFPDGLVKDVIIVDKHSDDGTIECAKTYGWKVLYDDKSLGSARLKGLREATTKWIAFIDSDIELPEDWFKEIISSLQKRFNDEKSSITKKADNFIDKRCSRCKHRGICWHDYDELNFSVYIEKEIKKRCPSLLKLFEFREYENWRDSIGWIYGRTIDDVSPLREEKLYKMKMELSERGRNVYHRAYTNNTICLREPLLNADIENLNAWEDYVLTQTMIKAGYQVIEFPVTCTHLRSDTYNKFGTMTEAWGIAGELKAKGWNLRTILRPFWFLYWGIRCTIHFHKIEHFRFNLGLFLSQIKALYINRKEAFEWQR